jgi:hypothetical protein
MGEYLEEAWTGENNSRTSLRDLADELNQAVLEAAFQQIGHSPTEYEIETTYEALTKEDVSSADALRKERELERDGIPMDELRRDFVSHQAIHTYLTKHRGVTRTDRSIDPEKKVDTLERLEGRTEAVATSTLSALIDADAVTDRQYEVFVDARVVCTDCGTDYSMTDLLSEGGCPCRRS